MKIKLSDYVIRFISGLGVRHIFLLPGGGCMHLVDSLGRCEDLEKICCLHEQAAVIAAEASGQYTNNIGAALVTTGPGSTNAITGVAGAWIDSTPIIVISGQAKRSDLIGDRGVRQMGIQEVDIVRMVSSITKYAVTVMDPNCVRYHLEKAAFLARTGRPGPVWIDIPLDVQGSVIEENDLIGFEPGTTDLPETDRELEKKVHEAIALLNHAKRPVILAGNGIRLSKAEEEFLRVIKALKIPVLTTWKAMDFLPEDHELYFGRPGSIGQRGANFIQQNSDFILALGARLDLAQIGHSYPNFAREARKVVVDIDVNEIRKMDMRIDVPICSDANLFLRKLIAHLSLVQDRDRSDWMSRCASWKKKYPVILPEYLKPKDPVNTYALVDALSDLLTENDVLVPGSSGSCSEITLQAFRVRSGQRILNTPGLGSMGFGLPASVGACLASGKKRTTCIIGDGGLQHNIQELETLRRLDIPVKLFVLNNNGYASIRNTHNRLFEGRLVCCDPSSGLTLPDTCRVASAYGLPAVKISGQKNLKEDVRKVLDMAGPVVCEVMIDPELQTAPKASSIVKPDGSILSKPLEDLWPFLERDEFEANMIIKPLDE
jgi:acetolactate synthase-1/2/3 large subunit